MGRLGRVLEASWGVLGGLGASWARLGASWRRLGASWVRLGASWGGKQRLEASWKLSAIWRGPGSQLRLAAGNQQISKRRKTYCRKTTYRKTTDLCRPPSSEPRHAAGRLRARCGSNAQQSCVPATALTFNILPSALLEIQPWDDFASNFG